MELDKTIVTIHMAASLDGFIARRDGSVDWIETSSEFAEGESMDAEVVAEFLKTIDCYVMGSKTYETALGFDAKGFGWAYGEKPVYVLTNRALEKRRETIHFRAGNLADLFNDELRTKHQSIWIAGGGTVAGEVLRLGLADEVRYSIIPVLIGDGIKFFDSIAKDAPLDLLEVKAYKNGIVALRYAVRRVNSEA